MKNNRKEKVMEDIYSFLLGEEEFEKIVSEKKVAHLFINSNKYKALAEGNVITFVYGEGEEKRTIEAVIDSILHFPTVTEAIESIGKEKCGFKNSQTFDKASDIFLSNESYEPVEKYGVGAILFSLKEKK